VRRTAAYYRDVLGFEVVEYLDAAEPHVCLYRGVVEVILTVARAGRGRCHARPLAGPDGLPQLRVRDRGHRRTVDRARHQGRAGRERRPRPVSL